MQLVGSLKRKIASFLLDSSFNFPNDFDRNLKILNLCEFK